MQNRLAERSYMENQRGSGVSEGSHVAEAVEIEGSRNTRGLANTGNSVQRLGYSLKNEKKYLLVKRFGRMGTSGVTQGFGGVFWKGGKRDKAI